MNLPLPIAFMERMRTQLGREEAERLFEALDSASPVAIRLNPAKSGEDGVWNDSEQVAWCKSGRKLKERPSFTLDTDFHAGAYYVQEAASQFIDHIIAGEELQGKRVLDMCAAPGGKTTIYSTAVGEDGLVVANEYVRSRANVLADNVRKWGLGNVLVTNNAPEHLSQFEGWFDMVAVDAPCSGEGMFRKEEVAREDWSEEAVKMCAARQMSIVREAWRSLKDGGLFIYSTCTFNDEEDEGVLHAFIEEIGDVFAPLQSVDIEEEWGIVRGEVGAFQTFRFFPHKTDSEGLFVAVARKAEPTTQRTPKARKKVMQEVDKSSRKELMRWLQEPDNYTFALVADTIYAYRSEQFKAVQALSEGLTAIYSGVAMGQIFKSKLKPDWALSQYVGLAREAVSVEELDEERALNYLRKHDIAVGDMAEGINLVTHKGRALGFAKRVGARCNNLYPNSLKIVNM
uniref:methyltransferase RsmF C-terminal domain-like protein n=1 Tax=Alistipes sp. TaxID=1872444 RepID=UPI004055D98D